MTDMEFKVLFSAYLYYGSTDPDAESPWSDEMYDGAVAYLLMHWSGVSKEFKERTTRGELESTGYHLVSSLTDSQKQQAMEWAWHDHPLSTKFGSPTKSPLDF